MTRLLAALAMLVSFSVGAFAQGRSVNVYNWTDYIDPRVLEEFQAETGIRVVYDVYDKNETLEAKLLAGASGYDVVVPSASFLQRYVQAGLLRRLDRGKLPNWRNLWPEVMGRLAAYDPGNAHAALYMWGTTGFGLNLRKVRERLGPDQPLNTLDLLMRPEIAAKLKDCGVYVLDAAEDVLPVALHWLKLPADSRKPEDLQRAGTALARVRENVRKFHSSEYINALASGDICMTYGYSGDVLQAKRRAEEAGNGVEIAYVVPREGALMWFDSFAIPVESKNVDEAHAFIDFMLRPDIAARNTNLVRFASGNLAAKARVAPEIANDPGVYPDEATTQRLFTNAPYDDRTQRVVTRLWTRVVTGR